MNIYSPRGSKVRFINKNGYDAELARARATFEVDVDYIVVRTNVGSWSSDVELEGVKGWWNTVMFENVEPATIQKPNKLITITTHYPNIDIQAKQRNQTADEFRKEFFQHRSTNESHLQEYLCHARHLFGSVQINGVEVVRYPSTEYPTCGGYDKACAFADALKYVWCDAVIEYKEIADAQP